MYSDVMVEAMIQTQERARLQHVAEGRALTALATQPRTPRAHRPRQAKPSLGQLFAWLTRRAPRYAAASA